MRVVSVLKSDGILPVVPIFTSLSSLGALAVGASAIAKAYNLANDTTQQFSVAKRHNRIMEAIEIDGSRKATQQDCI